MKTLIVLAFAILLAITNPDQQDFRSYVESEIRSQMRQEGEMVAGFASFFGLDSLAVNYVMSGVERQDFVILSVFSMEIDGEVYKFIGVANQIIPM